MKKMLELPPPSDFPNTFFFFRARPSSHHSLGRNFHVLRGETSTNPPAAPTKSGEMTREVEENCNQWKKQEHMY